MIYIDYNDRMYIFFYIHTISYIYILHIISKSRSSTLLGRSRHFADLHFSFQKACGRGVLSCLIVIIVDEHRVFTTDALTRESMSICYLSC